MNDSEHIFNRWWNGSYEALANERAGIIPGPKASQIEGVIAARAALESHRMMLWTRAMAIATVFLGAATVFLAVVELTR